MGLIKFTDKVGSKTERKHIRASELDSNFEQLRLINPTNARVFRETKNGVFFSIYEITVISDGKLKTIKLIGGD
jgi:hypothetical protein